MNDWFTAGKIAAEAREYAKEICKEGVLYAKITDDVEAFIRKKGAGIAFPMDVSVNSMAAHYCPFIDDKNVIQKGDLVKLDIGAHINGAVADNACTVEVGTNKHTELIKASYEAVKAAAELAQPGTPIRKIGASTQQIISDHGFTSIANLSGHGVGLYEVHAEPSIPNFDNNDERKLVEGQHIAIEPFATTGKGRVKEGKKCGVYRLVNSKQVRLASARQLIQHIDKEYKTLPFTERWLADFKNIKFLLALLEREGIIEQYTQLPDASDGMVSQHENTIEVGVGVTTKL